MIKTTDIFAHTIYEVDYPEFEKIQSDLITHINSSFETEYVNDRHDHPIRIGKVARLYDRAKRFEMETTIEDSNLKNLFDWMSYHGKKYWEILGLSEYLHPHILSMWATSIGRGGFVASHNHNPVSISGVFYVQSNSRLGNLFLENPMDLVLGRSAIKINETIPKRFNHEIESVSGKLVLFPGWMKHFTKPNPTDEIRISLAVNYGCHGEVYYTEFI